MALTQARQRCSAGGLAAVLPTWMAQRQPAVLARTPHAGLLPCCVQWYGIISMQKLSKQRADQPIQNPHVAGGRSLVG